MNTERDLFTTTSTMSKKLPRQAYISSSLDSLYGHQWRDQSKMQRAYFYSKYQKVIDIMDIFEIWTLNMLYSICLDYLKFDSPCRNTLKVICKYLTMDSILELKIVKTGALKPASVYFIPLLDQAEIDRFCKEYDEHEKAFQERKKGKTPEEMKEIWKAQSQAARDIKLEQEDLAKQTAMRGRK